MLLKLSEVEVEVEVEWVQSCSSSTRREDRRWERWEWDRRGGME